MSHKDEQHAQTEPLTPGIPFYHLCSALEGLHFEICYNQHLGGMSNPKVVFSVLRKTTKNILRVEDLEGAFDRIFSR